MTKPSRIPGEQFYEHGFDDLPIQLEKMICKMTHGEIKYGRGKGSVSRLGSPDCKAKIHTAGMVQSPFESVIKSRTLTTASRLMGP
mgnify:CR=1 FL=1